MIDLPPTEWAKVEAWAKKELESVRIKNDAISLPLEETSAYRGEIRLLKRILDLPNRATREVEAPPTSY
jgi:hypothetical protein